MTSGIHPVSLSILDQERFGMRTAKSSITCIDDISKVLDFCTAHEVEFLIVRCPTFYLNAVQHMERLGFQLMDTLLYFKHDLKNVQPWHDSSQLCLRPVREGEENAVRAVALEAFNGYNGHYHADNRLDQDACNEVYADWAYRSCLLPEVADVVLVADLGGKVSGFGTILIRDHHEGEGMLFGVSPSERGKGIYGSIMKSCLNWCVEHRLDRMIISTQVTNLASQKTWVRLGFEPSNSYYTFHRWFK